MDEDERHEQWVDKLVALHQHWTTAEAIGDHLRRSMLHKIRHGPRELTPEEYWADTTYQRSVMLAVCVHHSLLYVVIEGWRELGCVDTRVDELLAREDMTSALRLFRNSVFHFQPEVHSPKQEAFMKSGGSYEWVRALRAALRDYFDARLKVTIAPRPGTEPPTRH
ncbi:hypothetical protein EAH89_25515 [Roseomonas nepalensis]|uniref:Uncharacterized protein n=1 Tax=Muricoccus nepalensis TaxID=1854500 RepID=A0A502F9K6_9PROT|nr:hypothetical protein [Roseomonas nepalensis]TPG45984.1 hypothetical protein EAH89_25515 [Roseomonas nepalensis]